MRPPAARHEPDSAFLNVPSRLAKQLIALIDGNGPRGAATTLQISQNELARMLGVSREMVSKQLAVWREAGIVELGRRRLVVRDERALEQLIAGGQRLPRAERGPGKPLTVAGSRSR